MDCFPKNCIIKSNSEFGRFVTTTKNIKAGEILFEETPFACGPKQDSPCLCLSCYKRLDGSKNGSRCIKCNWPLCQNCPNFSDHRRECELFQKNSIKFQNSNSITLRCPQLDCITPLRVLLEMEENSERWEKEVMMMEDHEEERRNTDSWKMNEINIIKYLQGPCKLKERFSEELIQKVIGILEVNAFEAKTSDGYSIRCLYPKLAILAHSCTPNTLHNIFPSEGYKVKVRGTIDISEGDLLYSCYTYTLQGTLARQEHLRDGKYFICRCSRCLDSTELQTHFSSFKCKCDMGLIISENPIDEMAQWKCTNCPFKTSSLSIKKACNVMQLKIDDIKILKDGKERLQMCENLILKYKNILHPNHFILINLQQILIELYGRVEGYQMTELTDNLLERKVELCQNVLKILEILEPGKTRSKALLLYEIHVPLMLLTRSRYRRGEIRSDLRDNEFENIIKILEECIEIIAWEDQTSSIWFITKIAQQGLQHLKDSLPSIK